MVRKKKYRIIKVPFWSLSITFTLMMIVVILLNIPVLQTKLARIASKELSERINFNITIEKVRISWFDQVVVEKLSVLDEDSLLLFEAGELEINYDLTALIRDQLRLNSAIIRNLNFNLTYHSSDTLNISVFVNRLKTLAREPGGGGSAFAVDHLELENSSFHYKVDNSALASRRFNYKNFKLDRINGYMSNLVIRPDTFLIGINDLSAVDVGTGTRVSHLKTGYLISSQTMQFDSLEVWLNESYIKGNHSFHYNNYGAFGNCID